MKKLILVSLILTLSVVQAQVTFQHTYYKTHVSEASDVEQTSDGGYIAVGSCYADSSSQRTNILVVKTDAYGDTMWIRTFDNPVSFGPGSADAGKSVIQIPG